MGEQIVSFLLLFWRKPLKREFHWAPCLHNYEYIYILLSCSSSPSFNQASHLMGMLFGFLAIWYISSCWNIFHFWDIAWKILRAIYLYKGGRVTQVQRAAVLNHTVNLINDYIYCVGKSPLSIWYISSCSNIFPFWDISRKLSLAIYLYEVGGGIEVHRDRVFKSYINFIKRYLRLFFLSHFLSLTSSPYYYYHLSFVQFNLNHLTLFTSVYHCAITFPLGYL